MKKNRHIKRIFERREENPKSKKSKMKKISKVRRNNKRWKEKVRGYYERKKYSKKQR